MNVQDLLKSVRNDVRQGAYDQEELLLLCDKVEELLKQQRETFGDVRVGTKLIAKKVIRLYDGTEIPKDELFEVLQVEYNPVKDAYSAMVTPLNEAVRERINQVDGIQDQLAVYLNKQYNIDFAVVEERETSLEDW